MKRQLFSRWSRGLMSVVFLSLFVLTAAVFVGCEQKSPASVEPQVDIEKESAQALSGLAIPQEVMKPVATQYSYQGKLYEQDEFEKLNKDGKPRFTVAVADQADRQIAHVFDSEDALFSWAANTEFAAKFAQVRKAIAEARQGKNIDANASKGEAPNEVERNRVLSDRNDTVTFYDVYRNTSYGYREFKPLPVRLANLGETQPAPYVYPNKPTVSMNNTIGGYFGATPAPYPIVVVLFENLDFGGSLLLKVHQPVAAAPYTFGLNLSGYYLNNRVTSLIVI